MFKMDVDIYVIQIKRLTYLFINLSLITDLMQWYVFLPNDRIKVATTLFMHRRRFFNFFDV